MTKPTRKIKKRTINRHVQRKKPGLLTRVLRLVPAFFILATAFSIHQTPHISTTAQPRAVLSYATNMNVSDLLNVSNTQRVDNNVSALSLNTLLSNAAQTKANDMVTRNYWAHNTPDGKEPWYFMTNAGYEYKTAGENLAYGFDTGDDTVTGWMNSTSHRANLLNPSFSNVGFGFANSPDYISAGQQTVVVAMYGSPISQPVATPTSTQPQPATPTPSVSPASPSPVAAQPPLPTVVTPAQDTVAAQNAPVSQVSSDTSQPSVPSQPQVAGQNTTIRRIQLLAGSNASWSSTILATSLVVMAALWMTHHGARIYAFVRRGERYVLHNVHVDLTIFSLLLLGAALLQTSGFVY